MSPAPTVPTSEAWAAWLADAERRQREVFRLSPERLIAEHRREREITRGYHGREILELLQNAGDAARQSDSPGRVRIVVTPHGLVIGNTGRPFDTGGVLSLQTANLSPKRQCEAVVIGDKGLGFRSILNWTHSPLISSGALGLAFVPDYAVGIVSRLEQDNEDLARLVTAERSLAGDLIVPRLVFPQWVSDWKTHAWPEDEGLRSIAEVCQSLRSDGFETVIGMPFHTLRAYDEAVQQVDELRPEFLLLVNSIAQLEIRVDGRGHKAWTCMRSGNRATLREDDRDLSAWTINGHDGEVPKELLDEAERRRSRFQLTLAVPDDATASPPNLFCYFPTETGVPLPLLVHATVELDETRKHVNDTRANRHILGVLAELIADFAQRRLGRDGAGAWDGCRLVTAKGSWGSELEKFGFPVDLKAAAKTKLLIPIIGGGHRSAFEAKLPPGMEASWWPSRLFPEMVALSSKEEKELAAQLEVAPFTIAEIQARLLGAEQLTIEERARAIVGLIQSREILSGQGITSLLCDEAETPLPADTNAILQLKGEMPKLPSWATIRFVHPELRKRLARLLGASDGRQLQQRLWEFRVVEYSLSALIRPVIADANRQCRERPNDEYAIRSEAMQFLWCVHHGVEKESTFPSEVAVKVLNQEGKWTDPQHLYLGDGYGQEGQVTQDLFAGWAKGKLVGTPQMLGIDCGDVDTGEADAVQFLLWLGVVRWPRQIEVRDVAEDYLEAVKDSLPYPVRFGDCRITSPSELEHAWIEDAKTLDGIWEILRNAPPEAVLAWLALDPRAATWSRVTGHGTLQVVPSNKQYARSYAGAFQCYSYWQIATSVWLPSLDGIKRAPNKCLIGDRQLDVLFPSPGHLNPELVERYGISDRMHESFRRSGVMPGLAQLSRDELYRLLLEATELSPDGRAGRALCRWFVSNDSFLFGSSGLYQERFMREGKIWGAKDGTSAYYPIKELRHVDQEGLPPALTAKLAIADLPKRVGAQKVKEVLGIKPLELSEIQPELISHRPSPETENRALWFNTAKPYIKRLRQSQTKQSQAMGLFDRLALIVCDELCVRMHYEQTTYDHTAQEGESFIF